jgi:hypothetical protein
MALTHPPARPPERLDTERKEREQMTSTTQSPSGHPKWDAFTSSFKQSNYITDFWDWFMTLMSKAAEMVLFGTVLYSGYQLLPGVPHVPAPIDAAVFVIQQGALDIGGMGLLKLTKRAGLPRDSFPVLLGASLVVLMILNVVLASVKHTLPMIPDGVFVGIETLLLIVRAIVAVLFGHAIHALREEYGESAITVKEASELQQTIEGLSSELARVQQDIQRRLSSELTATNRRLTDLSERLVATDRRLTDQSDQLTDTFQPLRAAMQQHTSTLEALAALPARLSELERSLVSLTEAPAHKPRLSVITSDRQHRSVSMPTPVGSERPTDGETTDKGTFVRRCLTDNPTMRVADIQRQAASQGLTIAHSYISDLRKAFLAEQGKQETA